MTEKEKVSFLWIMFTVISAVIISGLNVLYFISQAASPLITSDAWDFLDMVIRKWAQVGFDLSDLFVKRGITDHAQPANKIALLINYKLFCLDFRYEGLIGFVSLLTCLSIFIGIYAKRLIANSRQNWLSAVAFISATFILTSLNATELYTWPLVTFGFLTLLLVLSTTLLTWKYLSGASSNGALVLSALLITLVGDTVSVILWASLLFTVALFLLSGERCCRDRSIKWVAASSVFIFLFFTAININFFYTPETRFAEIKTHVDWFDLYLYIEALRIVFSSSLVQAQHLAHLGSFALPVSWVAALIVFGFYVKHFVELFTSKTPHSLETFLTTSILIYATISVAAIAYGRIPVFGVDYLNQPRYVSTYQLIPFALLMNYAFSLLTNKNSRLGVVFQLIFSTSALFLIIMQLVFSERAHKDVEWISRYQDNQVKAIGNYLINPSVPTGNCTPYSEVVCNFPVDKRNELLTLLKTERLNLLNPSFQWKYRLFPLELNSTELKSEIKTLNVLSWGPNIVNATTNTVGVWVKLSHGLVDARSRLVVKIDNHRLDPVVDGNIITFAVPREISETSGRYLIELIDDVFLTSISVGIFEVKQEDFHGE